MSGSVSETDAREGLAAAERGRSLVIDEIDMPRWYWWSLAAGWVALGVVTDLRIAWLTVTATLVFGAAHASMFSAVSAGRRRTGRLQVRADTAGWFATVVILASVVGLGAVTVAIGWLASVDGARHPVTIASIPVAVALVLGGPSLMAAIRRRASRAHVVA